MPQSEVSYFYLQVLLYLWPSLTSGDAQASNHQREMPSGLFPWLNSSGKSSHSVLCDPFINTCRVTGKVVLLPVFRMAARRHESFMRCSVHIHSSTANFDSAICSAHFSATKAFSLLIVNPMSESLMVKLPFDWLRHTSTRNSISASDSCLSANRSLTFLDCVSYTMLIPSINLIITSG